MLTIVAFHPEGFEVRFQLEDATKLNSSISWLLEHGYRTQRGYSYTPEGLPLCPKHGVPMPKREKQGDEWYSHNVGTGDNPVYCRGYAGKTSPGYNQPSRIVDGSASSNGSNPPVVDINTGEVVDELDEFVNPVSDEGDIGEELFG